MRAFKFTIGRDDGALLPGKLVDQDIRALESIVDRLDRIESQLSRLAKILEDEATHRAPPL
jgi:hypothetical protein